MMQRPTQRLSSNQTTPAVRSRRGALLLAGAILAATAAAPALADPNFPITQQQRSTAKQVADTGVPLSELAPNAPDSYKVKSGDTLWAISGIFLKRPWRWPELWGMNLEQIRNPHLIYPGQILYLDKSNGRARLRLGQPVGPNGDVKLLARTRESALSDAIGAVPLSLIEPFLNEAVIFSSPDELAGAPRVVSPQEGRVMASRGETIYVLGDNVGKRDWRIFREPKPLKDPGTGEILGFEAAYVGTAEFIRSGGGNGAVSADGKAYAIPDTYQITSLRQEASTGDRLAPVPQRDYLQYIPHAPGKRIDGQVVSFYGEALSAGQNQIVSINKGASDGIERGHVLALWSNGRLITDRTDPTRPTIKLPDERTGLLFVFRVFDRMSYAVILSVQDPVRIGDRFTEPER